jgi:hypothetical protein
MRLNLRHFKRSIMTLSRDILNEALRGRCSLTQLLARAMRRLSAASWRLFGITRATGPDQTCGKIGRYPHCIRESLSMRSPGIEGIRAICIKVVVCDTYQAPGSVLSSASLQRSFRGASTNLQYECHKQEANKVLFFVVRLLIQLS